MVDKSSCKANIFHTFKGLVYSTGTCKGCNQDTALQFTTMNLIYLNVLSFVISTLPEAIYCWTQFCIPVMFVVIGLFFG